MWEAIFIGHCWRMSLKKITQPHSISILWLAEGWNGYSAKYSRINVRKLKDSAEHWQCRFEKWEFAHALWPALKYKNFGQSFVIIVKTFESFLIFLSAWETRLDCALIKIWRNGVQTSVTIVWQIFTRGWRTTRTLWVTELGNAAI